MPSSEGIVNGTSLVEDLAVPKAVCGPTGSHKGTCLRTLAGGSYMGNMDTQRMGIGTTIYVECQVEGCGVGTGDVHGAQGDGELSITAIEMESDVIMKLTVVKPGQPGYNVPNMAMYGGNSIKRMSPGEFVSFYGMPEKETGHVPDEPGKRGRSKRTVYWATTAAEVRRSEDLVNGLFAFMRVRLRGARIRLGRHIDVLRGTYAIMEKRA